MPVPLNDMARKVIAISVRTDPVNGNPLKRKPHVREETRDGLGSCHSNRSTRGLRPNPIKANIQEDLPDPPGDESHGAPCPIGATRCLDLKSSTPQSQRVPLQFGRPMLGREYREGM